MELVIIVSTITAFFCHFMIEKGVFANTLSAVLATLITWVLIADRVTSIDAAFARNILSTVVIALAISIIVGLVFAHHKRCS